VATHVVNACVDAYANHAVRFARGSIRVHSGEETSPINIARRLVDTAVAADARVLFALAADTEPGAFVEFAWNNKRRRLDERRVLTDTVHATILSAEAPVIAVHGCLAFIAAPRRAQYT
jgi:hypothetical protein